MNTRRLTTVEPDHRVQLPPDWAESLGLTELAALQRTDEGILVRAVPAMTWDEFFATKLPMNSGPATAEEIDGSGDDLLL